MMYHFRFALNIRKKKFSIQVDKKKLAKAEDKAKEKSLKEAAPKRQRPHIQATASQAMNRRDAKGEVRIFLNLNMELK